VLELDSLGNWHGLAGSDGIFSLFDGKDQSIVQMAAVSSAPTRFDRIIKQPARVSDLLR
jgi:hypothetical protein